MCLIVLYYILFRERIKAVERHPEIGKSSAKYFNGNTLILPKRLTILDLNYGWFKFWLKIINNFMDILSSALFFDHVVLKSLLRINVLNDVTAAPFRCLFLRCWQQKNTENGTAVTSFWSFLFRDDFSNCFFFPGHLLFPYSIWTYIFLFFFDFFTTFLFGLQFPFSYLIFFFFFFYISSSCYLCSILNFISLFGP